MKIFGISDLHLDINPLRFVLSPEGVNPYTDILLLAGDTCEACTLAPGVMHRPQVVEDLREICRWYDRVVMIFGNHEYYHNTIHGAQKDFAQIRKYIPNLTILHNQQVTVGVGSKKVKILGSELWTDFNQGNSLAMIAAGSMMNDYRLIKILRDDPNIPENSFSRVLVPHDTLKFHQDSKKFLNKWLSKAWPNPMVVMVHHAPIISHASPPNGGVSVLDYSFVCTDVEDMILGHQDKAKIWFHGHTHEHKQTKVGDATVVTNARGYSDPTFKPILLLEV